MAAPCSAGNQKSEQNAQDEPDCSPSRSFTQGGCRVRSALLIPGLPPLLLLLSQEKSAVRMLPDRPVYSSKKLLLLSIPDTLVPPTGPVLVDPISLF